MSDHNDDPIIGLDLEGPRVTLDRLIQAAGALATILKDVDTETTARAGGALEWVVSGLRGGSAHLDLQPVPKDDRVPFRMSRQVVTNFARGMAIIADRAERPPFFTFRALESARQLNALTTEGGITAVTIRINGERLHVGKDIANHVRTLVEGDLRSIGSVEGRLETVSIHGQRYFNVYDSVTGKPVRCLFPQEMLDQVSDALGKRVAARGILHSRRTGETASMKVDRLDVFEDESEFPTVGMMRGILNHG